MSRGHGFREAITIVRALAGRDPYDRNGLCKDCDSSRGHDHTTECLYERARQWRRRRGEPEGE